MVKFKITDTQGRKNYSVIYDCGCIRDAVKGHFNPVLCKNNHEYNYDCVRLECNCWDAYSGPHWCEEHIKFHEEAKIHEKLYFAENKVIFLKKCLEKYMKADTNIENI